MPRHKTDNRQARQQRLAATKVRDIKPRPEVSRQQAFDRIVVMLTEFFDAAVVSVTWQEVGKTYQLSQDIGNKFAVTGLVEDLSMDHSEFNDEDDEDDDDDDGFKGGKPA